MLKKCGPARCQTGHVIAISWVLSFLSSFRVFSFFFLGFGFVSSFCLFEYSSANMAHSSSYGRTVPERSRSRDDPMWQCRHSQQRGRQYDLAKT